MHALSTSQKLKVLAFAGVFFPGYKGGGPIKTIKNLFEHTGKQISFRLVTSDRDLGDTRPYSSVTCGKWNQIGDASVFYAQPGSTGYKQIADIIRKEDYDIVYLNSFFSPRFSLYPLLLAKAFRKRVVLSPRGEFSEGALSIKSFKKSAFIFIYKALQIYRGTVFQASSKFEAQDIRRVFGPRTDVYIAENIGAREFGGATHERRAGALHAVFVSRISPMKNLLMALESMRGVQEHLVFHIYGPIEDKDYWEQCLRVIETLPKNVEVEYRGSLEPADVVRTMNRYDVFYLPTKGENYGHAISEAICAGLPIVISDTTPWRNLQEQGIGWDLPLNDPSAFSAVLDYLAAMPEDEYQNMRLRVLAWAENKFSQRDAVEANIALFRYAYERK